MPKQKAERNRFSPRKKVKAGLRLSRSEELNRVPREQDVLAAMLWAWCDQFFGGGQAGFKRRTTDGRAEPL